MSAYVCVSLIYVTGWRVV